MGNAKKPTRLKILQGNPGHQKLRPQQEPHYKGPVKGAYKVPAGLSHKAGNEWRRVVKELGRLGLYQIVDRAALCAYCEAWSTMLECQEVINKQGLTYKVRNSGGTFINERPEVKIRNAAWQQVRYLSAEFGFTPSSRSKIEMPQAEPAVDSLQAALNKPREIQIK
tara:strand:- start:2495 stop:2992 length:498 start_codon:yes stop_codon:yes gene_type:complete